MKISATVLLLALMSVINFESYAQPGYAGEWKKTRLYGHSFNSGDFTDEEYDWIRDHFEYFTIEKTHLRGIYGNPSHELTSRLTATKLIEANPRCKPLMIYSIGGAYPTLFESEAQALIDHPDYFLYDENGDPDKLNLDNPAENDWYIETINKNTENSDLYGIFVDGFKGNYTGHPGPVQYIMPRITDYTLVNGMDFAPGGKTIRSWPESLEYCDGLLIDSFLRRRVMDKDAGVVLLDACLEIPSDKMLVCFSAYDGYSSTFEFSHAAYLIVAHENTYYRWVDEGDHTWSSQSLMTWYDVFDREMGAPLGQAEKNGYVYTRQFRYCTVTLDVENITSNIQWGQNNGVPVTGVSLTAGRNTIGIGDTLQLSASVTPSNATDQGISWWSVSDSSIATISQDGILTALNSGRVIVTAKSSENDFTSTFTVNITDSDSSPITFEPDPTKKYHIDIPFHNLRLAATGEDDNPYTTSTNTTGETVEWVFVDRGNGFWHIQLAADVSKPRLRTRNNGGETDMEATSSNGTWTYWDITQGYLENTYFLTLPHGPGIENRLQVDHDGNINMVDITHNETWESFTLTEVGFIDGNFPLVHIKKRNADDFAIDGNWDAENRQNVYIWTSDETNINQLWYEIDRGDGYYSYQKYGTDYCLDGDKEGADGQSVYLWERDDDNWNQHWKKVSTGSGTYRLEKRNAPDFALDGGEDGIDGQDLYLWTIGNTNENQQWIFTYVEEPQQKFLESTNVLLNFYPNPVQSLALIQNAENSTLNVYDVTGKLLLTQNIVTNTAEVDLSGLGKGIYYAKITSLTSIDVLKIVKE